MHACVRERKRGGGGCCLVQCARALSFADFAESVNNPAVSVERGKGGVWGHVMGIARNDSLANGRFKRSLVTCERSRVTHLIVKPEPRPSLA